MRVAKHMMAGTVAAVVAAGCSGISDCKEDVAQCAALLNENAEKCAFNYQLTQGDDKRKHCENAVRVVSKAAAKEALPGLTKILATPETATPNDAHRAEAAKAIAKIGDKSAVQALIDAVDLEAGSSSDPKDKSANRTNEQIAEALGKLGDERGCDVLVKLMQRSRYDYAVLKSVRALGRIGCKSAVDPVSEVALKHENKFMRKNAVIALGDIADLKATDTLIQMMFVEFQGVSFYREASFALFQLGPGVADALLKTMAGENEAVNAWFKKQGGLQTTAVKAKCGFVLGDLRDERAVQPLIEAFQEAVKNSDPVLQIYSAAPLGALGDPRAVKVLAEHMMDLDASKRGPLMSALNQLGDRSVVPEMIKGLTPEHFIETCVKLGLADKDGCMADKASLAGAIKAATDSVTNLAGAEHDAELRKAAASIETKEIKEYVEKRLVRLDAAKECKADAGCWAKKLSDPEPLVRERAAWELGRLKDKSTLPALQKALGDENTYVRSAAIASYWAFGDKSALDFVGKQLEDDEGKATFVRVNEDLKRLLVHLQRLP